MMNDERTLRRLLPGAGFVPFLVLLLSTGGMSAMPRCVDQVQAEESCELSLEEQEIIRLLHRIRVPDPPEVDLLAPQVVTQGVGQLHFLLEILEQERVPALDEEAVQILSRAQRGLILGSLPRYPLRNVLEIARVWIADDEASRRATAIAALGTVADAEELPRIFDRALPRREKSLDGRIERELGEAIARILQRDRAAVAVLRSLWRDLRRELVPGLILAIGDSSRPEALLLLSDILESRPETAPVVIPQIRLLTPPPSVEIAQDLADLVRPYLDCDRPNLVQATSVAVAELEDAASVPRLIELLVDEMRGVRESALWSLRRLSGMELAPNQVIWADWYEAEQNWYDRRRRHIELVLRSEHRGKVVSALEEAMRHSLFRHELSAVLRICSGHDDPVVRTLACRVLGGLGSPDSVPHLVDSLVDEREEVRTAANVALTEVTRLGDPADTDRWQEILDDRGYEL